MAATLNVLILGCCILTVGSTFCLLSSLPLHALVSCDYQHNKLVCQATCTKGYMFRTLELKLLAACDLDTGQWDAVMRDCIAVCRTPLLAISPGTFNITASSVYMNMTDTFGPEMARSTRDGGVWRPEVDNRDQFLQITFPDLYRITGVVTQGDHGDNYVTEYRMLFSVNGNKWFPYRDPSTDDKCFCGNSNTSECHTEPLPCPHTALYARLNPVRWNNNIALKMDLLGCPYQRSVLASSPFPTSTTMKNRCQPIPPPHNGTISCERKDGLISCAYTCNNGYVFEKSSDIQPIVITRQCSERGPSEKVDPIPKCVEGNSNQHPKKNTSDTCLQEFDDCSNMRNGDYQFCGDCHYFATCAEYVFYVRKCPSNLKFNRKTELCDYQSNTCETGIRKTPPGGQPWVPSG